MLRRAASKVFLRASFKPGLRQPFLISVELVVLPLEISERSGIDQLIDKRHRLINLVYGLIACLTKYAVLHGCVDQLPNCRAFFRPDFRQLIEQSLGRFQEVRMQQLISSPLSGTISSDGFSITAAATF